jgi:signal peptidase I
MTPVPGESSYDSLALMGDSLQASLTDEPVRRAGGGGRHSRSVGAHRPMAARPPTRPDYRLRSLDLPAVRNVPTVATRMDGPRTRRRAIPRLASAVVLLALAALAALALDGIVMQPYSVPGKAMTPTFSAGDRILVVRSGVLPSPIRVGQIVVFRPPRELRCTVGGHGGDLVSRVVAVPGQTIWSVGETIFVDGQPLRDPHWYNTRFGQLGSTPISTTRLGHGQYYVLADNRSDACDSRAFGPISGSSVVGAGIAIVARDGHVFFRTL